MLHILAAITIFMPTEADRFVGRDVSIYSESRNLQAVVGGVVVPSFSGIASTQRYFENLTILCRHYHFLKIAGKAVSDRNQGARIHRIV
jgi:hypothetical protein